MNRALSMTLARTLLKIFFRDRQSIFFTLFFPVIFMVVFGFINDGNPDPVKIGIVDKADSEVAGNFIGILGNNPLFSITRGSEEELRAALLEGDETLVLILPEEFQDSGGGSELTLLVDASQVRQLALIMPSLEQALVNIERSLRNSEPLFSLKVEDVKARSQRYIDFLVPGLLAFTLMQISIGGSGFNIVEYRRKGILKRLFVTPIAPGDFIAGLVLSRLLICLMQLSILLLIAVFLLKISIVGNLASLYLIIILGTMIFLCLGFCVGSFAKTQQTVAAVGNIVIFPQIFLSGIFYPLASLPALIQPIAAALPLTFVANALREIINNGLSLAEIATDLIGMGLWLAIAFILAVRLFVWKEVAA
ncbi:MAG: ABC transporter permease [Pseudomonadales bacterium]|nr:ABC transporter permease [Pseudomonadales bacterium]